LRRAKDEIGAALRMRHSTRPVLYPLRVADRLAACFNELNAVAVDLAEGAEHDARLQAGRIRRRLDRARLRVPVGVALHLSRACEALSTLEVTP
jgi:hypothetical protein